MEQIIYNATTNNLDLYKEVLILLNYSAILGTDYIDTLTTNYSHYMYLHIHTVPRQHKCDQRKKTSTWNAEEQQKNSSKDI